MLKNSRNEEGGRKGGREGRRKKKEKEKEGGSGELGGVGERERERKERKFDRHLIHIILTCLHHMLLTFGPEATVRRMMQPQMLGHQGCSQRILTAYMEASQTSALFHAEFSLASSKIHRTLIDSSTA